MSDQSAMPAGPVAGLRQNRNWRLLWFGQAVSITGNYVFNTTVVLWIATIIAKDKSWGPAAVGGVLVAASVPALVLGPAAGVFVDRWNRRRTMMTSDACCTVLIASLLLLPTIGAHLSAGPKLGIIYAVVAAASCFAQFFSPARMAMLSTVVAPADRIRATSVFQSTMSFATIIGPPIAAPLLIVFGVQWALCLDAASFAVSLASIAAIRLATRPRTEKSTGPSFGREFAAGLRFFRGSPVLIAIAVGVIVATLGTGAISVLMVYFLKANLHAAPNWLGTLDGAEGVGAVAGALAAGWLAARIGSGRVFWAGLMLAGVLVIVLAMAGSLPIALVTMTCIGLAVGAVNVVIGTLVFGVTPQDMLGRVTSVVGPLATLASIVSIGAFGYLASSVLRSLHAVVLGVTFGPYDTIFAACGLLFVVAGLAAMILVRAAAPAQEGPPQHSTAPGDPGHAAAL